MSKSSGSDGRRRQWVAVPVDLIAEPFMVELVDRFGWGAYAAWVAFQCAAKRAFVPGQLTYTSEAEALAIAGLDSTVLDGWTLAEFFAVTGRFKETATTSRGRATKTVFTRFGEVQNTRATRPGEHSDSTHTALGQPSDSEGTAANTQVSPEEYDHVGTPEREREREREKESERERILSAFEAFWKLYPRKVGKPKAKLAYSRSATIDSTDRIEAGLRGWLASWTANATEEQFIPHPTTWLNQQRWSDPPPRVQIPKSRRQEQQEAQTASTIAWLAADQPALAAEVN